MNLTVFKISIFIHILCATFWIGGMVFTAFVFVPITRHKMLASKRGLFFAIMGKRFSKVSWILFGILLITGYIQLSELGFTYKVLLTNSFWHTQFGSTLALKLLAFSLVLAISGLHDFWLGPKAAALIDKNPDDPKTTSFRKVARWVGRINLLLGLLILYYAISLVFG